MTVRLGSMTFSDWISLPHDDGWTDTFVFRVSSQACLPPYAYVPLIKRLTVRKVRNLRCSMSLWVQVDAPGEWFAAELRRSLQGLQLPYAVTNGEMLEFVDFSYPPWLGVSNSGRPPNVEDEPSTVSAEELLCLQALGRMVKGKEEEIASLADLSTSDVTRMLYDLEMRKLVVFKRGYRIGKNGPIKSMPDPHLLWHLTRRGTSLALRSWGVPKTVTFDRRARGERHLFHLIGEHRTISRKWLAWLKTAWPQVDVWAGWSEVGIPEIRVVPDTLAWGRVQGYETLFWLEVGDDHRDRATIEAKMRKRFLAALRLARRTRVRLVLAILGPRWVQNAASWAFENLPDDVAVVMGRWKHFGELPALEWGRVMRD